MQLTLHDILRAALIVPVALAMSAAPAQAQSERRVSRLAEGVYTIEHADAGDGNASGNTTVIIGERQVLVVDAGYFPSAALEDIAQIRQWTDKPVSFLVNTHFHNDHNLGNSTYLEAFPALTILAHTETKRDMEVIGPGMMGRMERSTARLQRFLDNGRQDDGTVLTENDSTAIKNALALRPALLAELRRSRFQPPTLVFDDGITLDIGNRVVEIKFLGRGNTPGDVIVHLPNEQIAVVGDLVVHPIPYFYDGYPSEWTRTLDRVGQLDVTAIVPGHGPVLRDKSYVMLLRDLLKSAVDQIAVANRQVGPAMFRTVEDFRPLVDLTAFRERFAGADKDLSAQFDAMTGTLLDVAFKEASLR